MVRDDEKLEVWRLLRAGKQRLLEREGATLELRGLRLGDSVRTGGTSIEGLLVRSVSDDLRVEKVEIEQVDVSGSNLCGLSLKHSTLRNCDLSSSSCRSWRVWASSFEGCSFRESDFRDSLLGGVLDGQWTVFHSADFRGADLRATIYAAAEFVDCDFSGAKLVGLDFQGSKFTRCRFGGQLEDVVFYRRAPTVDVDLENEMEGVDFSRCTLRGCEFRGLTLSGAVLPSESAHLIVPDYDKWLDQQLGALDNEADPDARAFRAFLEVERRWRGLPGAIGVLNRSELREFFGRWGEETAASGETR